MAPAEATPATLTGNYGRAAPPKIETFVVRDPTDADDTYGVGDIFTISIDIATNRGRAGNDTTVAPPHVDELFRFSASLGSNYTGDWLDDST